MNEATDRNVFILGAGFSAGAGAPLIQDFLDRSRELHDDPSRSLSEKLLRKNSVPAEPPVQRRVAIAIGSARTLVQISV
jgi:hypothetical protein